MRPRTRDHVIYIDEQGRPTNALVLDVRIAPALGPLCDLIIVLPSCKADVRMGVREKKAPSDADVWAWPSDVGMD